jgi:A/G-specific adenine glycosylase
MEHHGGELPRDPEALLALPGVGAFTAGIVRCFGWGDDAIAVDTNVVRVLGRLVHGDLQPAKETPPAAVLATAERLLPRGKAAHWNPALMDYGARVCTPRPHCDVCVVSRWCAARPRFEAGERATPIRAQGAFDGSDRQWRGRIMRHLRAHPAPLRTSALLAALAPTPEDASMVRRLLAALCEEGMTWQRAGWCGLGDRPPE